MDCRGDGIEHRRGDDSFLQRYRPGTEEGGQTHPCKRSVDRRSLPPAFPTSVKPRPAFRCYLRAAAHRLVIRGTSVFSLLILASVRINKVHSGASKHDSLAFMSCLSLRRFRLLRRNEVADFVVERCAEPNPALRIRHEFAHAI